MNIPVKIANFHTPVLLQEAVDALQVKPGQWYVDTTLGGGGHSNLILAQGGLVLGIDQDQQALDFAKAQLETQYPDDHFILIHDSFGNLAAILERVHIQPAGVLIDLGVSSYQLGGNGRGFSFQVEETLDMRMNPDAQTVMAKDLVNGLYEQELAKLITTYGEDPLAKMIAKAIVRRRQRKPFYLTTDLAHLIEQLYRRVYKTQSEIHAATKTFQALRIAVNDEIHVLESGLEQALTCGLPQARVVVISFHGLEQSTVNQQFTQAEQAGIGTIITDKPIRPGYQEQKQNRRSRSATLQVFRKN